MPEMHLQDIYHIQQQDMSFTWHCTDIAQFEHHAQSKSDTHTRIMTVSENITGLEYILVLKQTQYSSAGPLFLPLLLQKLLFLQLR